MLQRRRNLDPRRYYDRAFFERLVQVLVSSGFTTTSVVLPHNWSGRGPTGSEVSVDAFLKESRRYPSIILKAQNPATNETVKLLLITELTDTSFVDSTFPTARYGPSQLAVESPDAARLYSLTAFLFEMLSRPYPSLRFLLKGLLALCAIIAVGAESIVWLGHQPGLLVRLGMPGWVDKVAAVVVVALVLRFFTKPHGLWINPPGRPLSAFWSAVRRSRVRDNPLVLLLVTIVGGVIVAWLAKLLGIL